MKPYYADDSVTLYHGDCRDVLPQLTERPDSCVTDPPYGETSAAWDVWQDGWVDAVSAILPPSASLWSFGSARMFLAHVGDFSGWRFAQEALWVKRAGSGPTDRSRLVRIHEWAYHWYRGRWTDLHHEWEREPHTGPEKGYVRSFARGAAHQREGRAYGWRDDGTRQPKSVTFVIEAPSVRYQKRHQDEKPVGPVLALVREGTPPGGLVLDAFAGAATTAIAARLCGRRAVLIEGDEKTCETAAVRLSEMPLPLEVS